MAEASDSRAPGPAAVFGDIFRRRGWGDGETVSGFGSTRAATKGLRRVLPLILEALDVKTMLDIPCGDLNWMRPDELPLERYIGADVVPEVVEIARGRGAGGEFLTLDISSDPLPAVDLVFCRDCLGHLSDELTKASLQNVHASGSRYLMATTFYSVDRNRDRPTGGWMPINLELPPYSLPPPLLMAPERVNVTARAGAGKSLGVWELDDEAVGQAIGGLWSAAPAP